MADPEMKWLFLNTPDVTLRGPATEEVEEAGELLDQAGICYYRDLDDSIYFPEVLDYNNNNGRRRSYLGIKMIRAAIPKMVEGSKQNRAAFQAFRQTLAENQGPAD